MIIFYQKSDGQIVSVIEGRIHDENHLKMWVGDKNEIDRLVIQWKPVAYYDKEGNMVDAEFEKIFAADFEPDHEQKDLIMLFETNSLEVYTYKVDLQSKKLIKK